MVEVLLDKMHGCNSVQVPTQCVEKIYFAACYSIETWVGPIRSQIVNFVESLQIRLREHD